jgi:hypothetical protein
MPPAPQVRADPKKLPTARLGEKWLCQWEQLGLPCPTEADHFVRNGHQTCAYCLVIGHTLRRCPQAKRDGLDLALLDGS